MSHLENVSEEEINRLLGMVVDVENLFMSVHKEEDTDTKQVYFYLFKVSFPRVHVRELRGGGWWVCRSGSLLASAPPSSSSSSSFGSASCR